MCLQVRDVWRVTSWLWTRSILERFWVDSLLSGWWALCCTVLRSRPLGRPEFTFGCKVAHDVVPEEVKIVSGPFLPLCQHWFTLAFVVRRYIRPCVTGALGFLQFNSQDRIGTGPWLCHFWEQIESKVDANYNNPIQSIDRKKWLETLFCNHCWYIFKNCIQRCTDMQYISSTHCMTCQKCHNTFLNTFCNKKGVTCCALCMTDTGIMCIYVCGEIPIFGCRGLNILHRSDVYIIPLEHLVVKHQCLKDYWCTFTKRNIETGIVKLKNAHNIEEYAVSS